MGSVEIIPVYITDNMIYKNIYRNNVITYYILNILLSGVDLHKTVLRI